jgi:hypothetical protein
MYDVMRKFGQAAQVGAAAGENQTRRNKMSIIFVR